jgi:hypothetical protein
MAVISLSLLPLPPPPSSHSLFCTGGIHLRSHNNFLSIHSSPSSSTFSNSNTKFSSGTRPKRFFTVFAASSDYYSTLGVPKSATGKEIKAAYRRLARQVSFYFPFFSCLVNIRIYLVWFFNAYCWFGFNFGWGKIDHIGV